MPVKIGTKEHSIQIGSTSLSALQRPNIYYVCLFKFERLSAKMVCTHCKLACLPLFSCII